MNFKKKISYTNILSFLKEYNYSISTYQISEEGVVDVFGDFTFKQFKMDYFPIKFGIIHGSFICSSLGLKSLEGGPTQVFGNYLCDDNILKNLIGCAEYVNGYLAAECNPLKNVEGASKKVNGDIF